MHFSHFNSETVTHFVVLKEGLFRNCLARISPMVYLMWHIVECIELFVNHYPVLCQTPRVLFFTMYMCVQLEVIGTFLCLFLTYDTLQRSSLLLNPMWAIHTCRI